MTYIIRHVRYIQSMDAAELLKVFQVDGRLNPTDAFTKWLPHVTRAMFYAFLRGNPQRAYQMWIQSAKFKQFQPKKIVPEPDDAVQVDVLSLGSANANDPMGISTMSLEELKQYRQRLLNATDEVERSHRVSRMPVIEARIGSLEKEAQAREAERAAVEAARDDSESEA